jgi:hypothetical protein
MHDTMVGQSKELRDVTKTEDQLFYPRRSPPGKRCGDHATPHMRVGVLAFDRLVRKLIEAETTG